MPEMITMQCARCGAVFQREASRAKKSKKPFCSKSCAARSLTEEYMDKRFQKKIFPKNTRIRITASIPVFPELRPKVGAVYDALKFTAQQGGDGGYVIECGGKKINVRKDEAVEV